MRQGAHTLREMFVALINEDFTEQQALQIIGVCIAAQMGGGS